MHTSFLFRPIANHPHTLGSLLLTLVVTSSFVSTSPVTASAAEGTVGRLPPPAYPDTAHVFNGCHLSTLAYLARFSAKFPGEQGLPIIVRSHNYDGHKPHTLALVSWRGTWWCRDENFGVFPLNCTVAAEPDSQRLVGRAERLCEQHSREAYMKMPAALRPPRAPTAPSDEQRLRAVWTATRIIPFPHTIYWVREGSREVPVLFFRPANGVIAVYDPAHGTGVAQCDSRDDAGIVAQAASSMGYRAVAVRAEFKPSARMLVAVASIPLPTEASR